jgi:hypothetical protein
MADLANLSPADPVVGEKANASPATPTMTRWA